MLLRKKLEQVTGKKYEKNLMKIWKSEKRMKNQNENRRIMKKEKRFKKNKYLAP